MEVKIDIESECPVPYQTSDLKINLNNIECIGDLKKKLQPLLSVAACDMSVYHKTSRKLENREKISNLYVREGDTFIVKFTSVCKLHLLSKFLDDMRAFVKDVCEAFSDGDRIMENIDWNADSFSAVENCYAVVLQGLERYSQGMFLPWKSKPTNANKHYFVQEGGMDLLATIYNFASKKRYPLTLCERDLQVPRYFNHEQNILEVLCLKCLWCFSESKEDRQMVLRKIGLEPFIHSLLKVSSPDIDDDIREDVCFRVNQASMGCLSQYVELPDTQQILAENQEVLSKLHWLTSNDSNSYQKEVAANTLFCCSNHPKAARKIIENQCYRLVLEKAQELELARKDPSALPFTAAVAYFLSLFLANIQILPEENLLPCDEIQQINQVLEAFLDVITPSEIGRFEAELGYVWITLIPFLRLALAGPSRPLGTENEPLQTCPQVSVDPRSEIGMGPGEKSCDAEISNNRGIGPYNFSPAEKIGLFCLCHLANVPENRELFKKEKLEDYLICVCWFAQRCPEVADLTPKLDGFERLEPPRLESIAKAYLSKCFGRKIK